MARDQIDMTPLQSRDELVAWIEAGVKPESEFRLGTEHEKTPFTLEGHHPVPYEGAKGIGALLEADRAVPEPQLEHLFKVVLVFDQSEIELPDNARTVKVEIARRLIDRYYEGHSPEYKRKALEELTKITQ